MMDNQKKQKLQDSAKEIYDSIIIPPELSDIVNKSIKAVDKEVIDMQYKNSYSGVSTFMKYFGAVAAVIFISIFIGLNSSESFAKEMGEVPVLGSVARVFTVRKYELEKKELTKEEEPIQETVEPKIENNPMTVSGNDEQKEQESVSANDVSANNGIIGTKVTISGNDIVTLNGNDKEIVDTLNPPAGTVTVSGNAAYEQALSASDFGVEINKRVESYVQNYAADGRDVSYEIKFQRGAVVSFVVTAVQQGDIEYEERNFYNLDLLNGKNVVLSDLLGNNYASVANVQIVRQMEERVRENPEYVYWGVAGEGVAQGFDGFSSVDEDTEFYINAAGNAVIVFDKNIVAPGFMGVQEFEMVVARDMTLN